jgi:hypothetical protein
MGLTAAGAAIAADAKAQEAPSYAPLIGMLDCTKIEQNQICSKNTLTKF